MITRSQERAHENSPKLNSVQTGRPMSKNRDQSRSQSRDKSQFSKSSFGFKPRSLSRDKRYPSKDQQSSSSRDSRKDKYENRRTSDRSQSRSGQSSNHYSRERSQSGKSSSDEKHKECLCYKCKKRMSPRSGSRDERKGKSYERSSSRARAQSRDQSRDARKLYPEMKKGENCGYDYNPLKTKWCRKCPPAGTHHEFQCYKYEKYSPVKCTVCEKYNHFGRDCKEVNSFPPKVSELNSQLLDGKN